MGSEAQIEASMPATEVFKLEVSDVQATVLRPRPRPYKGEYLILRIDEATQGREMLRRLIPHVAPADDWWVPSLPGWLGIAFTYQRSQGARPASSFSGEFSQGIPRRNGGTSGSSE